MPNELIVFRQLSEFLRWREENSFKFAAGESVGLISTKGAIHEGHLALGSLSLSPSWPTWFCSSPGASTMPSRHHGHHE